MYVPLISNGTLQLSGTESDTECTCITSAGESHQSHNMELLSMQSTHLSLSVQLSHVFFLWYWLCCGLLIVAVVALLLQALAMWPMCEHLLHLADLNRHSDGLYPAPRHPLQGVELFPISPIAHSSWLCWHLFGIFWMVSIP